MSSITREIQPADGDASYVAKVAITPQYLKQIFTRQSIFSGWTTDQFVTLIPKLDELLLQPEEQLQAADAPIDYLYFVCSGQLKCGEMLIDSEHPPIGIDEVTQSRGCLNDAIVATETTHVIAVPIKLVKNLLAEQLNDNSSFWHSLFRRQHATTRIGSHEKPETEDKLRVSSWTRWFIALALPLWVYMIGGDLGLSWDQHYYLTILCACLTLLLLDVVPQYAAVLLAALACLLLEIVPVNVVLSGFASGGFFMALSIFGISSVLLRSGLAIRLILVLMRFCPVNSFAQNLVLTITGIILTPCLPSANTRIALLAPLVRDSSDQMGYQHQSPEATRMMLSVFVGCSIFAPIFLTSKSLNFVLYNMLPQQISAEYQWINWFMAAAIFGLYLLVSYSLVTAIIFRKQAAPKLSKAHIVAQLELKGRLTSQEWIALIGISLFILAIVSYSFHKISLFWIGFGFLCIFLIVHAFSDKNVKQDIEWDVLLLIGVFIGLENALQHTGISQLLSSSLSVFTEFIDKDYYLLILFCLVLIALLRLFLPITTAGVLSASVILPIAEINGFDLWLTSFIVLTLSECWLWPKQASYYGTYVAVNGGQPIHQNKLFLQVNLMTVLLRVSGLFLFVYYLKYLGTI